MTLSLDVDIWYDMLARKGYVTVVGEKQCFRNRTFIHATHNKLTEFNCKCRQFTREAECFEYNGFWHETRKIFYD